MGSGALLGLREGQWLPGTAVSPLAHSDVAAHQRHPARIGHGQKGPRAAEAMREQHPFPQRPVPAFPYPSQRWSWPQIQVSATMKGENRQGEGEEGVSQLEQSLRGMLRDLFPSWGVAFPPLRKNWEIR